MSLFIVPRSPCGPSGNTSVVEPTLEIRFGFYGVLSLCAIVDRPPLCHGQALIDSFVSHFPEPDSDDDDSEKLDALSVACILEGFEPRTRVQAGWDTRFLGRQCTSVFLKRSQDVKSIFEKSVTNCIEWCARSLRIVIWIRVMTKTYTACIYIYGAYIVYIRCS